MTKPAIDIDSILLSLGIALLTSCISSDGIADIDVTIDHPPTPSYLESSEDIISGRQRNETASTSCSGPHKDSVIALWKEYVSPLIAEIDIHNGKSLYNAQSELMYPTYAIFELGCENLQEELILGLKDILSSLPYLEELRKDGVLLDIFYQDPKRSGMVNRRIFPKTNDDGEIYFGWGLEELQFSYLLATAAKGIVKNSTRGTLSTLEKEFLLDVTNFLANELITPLWTTIEAGWYPEVGNFPNMKQRLAAKLDDDTVALHKKSFYGAIIDHDLFFLAIAADLQYITTQMERLPCDETTPLEEIMIAAQAVVRKRAETESGGFRFDVGAFDDHRDHAYAEYFGIEYPQKKIPAQQGTWDSSHSHRWPWWLTSSRDAYPSDSDEYVFFESLLYNLGDQFINCVVEYTNEGPLLNNFLDGRNGWYRVNKDWRYGPYTLSATARYGSWYLLTQFHPNIVEYS